MPPTLRPATETLRALITPTAGALSSAHTDELHTMLEPMHDAAEHVHDKLTEVLRAVRRAKMVETHDHGRAFFGYIQGDAESAIREIQAAQEAIDRAAQSCRQLDAHALDWQVSLATYGERMKNADA